MERFTGGPVSGNSIYRLNVASLNTNTSSPLPQQNTPVQLSPVPTDVSSSTSAPVVSCGAPSIDVTNSTLCLFSDGFQETLPTVVISHGTNPVFDTTFGSTSTPDWMIRMAKAINFPNKKANVLLWNWQKKAKIHTSISAQRLCSGIDLVRCSFGIPYDNVEPSGRDMAQQLEAFLCGQPGSGCAATAPTYTSKIHLIGHSLGAGVITYAAKYLGSYQSNIDQLTLLDSAYLFPPAGTELSDLRNRPSNSISNSLEH